MLNYTLLKNPLNWLTVVLMLWLACMFFNLLANAKSGDCGCNHKE